MKIVNNDFFIKNIKRIVAIKFEKKIVGISIFCIIINTFGYWHIYNLVIFFIITKYLEISFYNIILSFSLTISVKIKDC